MVSLLVGNGINRLSSKSISWKALLDNLTNKAAIEQIEYFDEKPYLHIYEEIYTNFMLNKKKKGEMKLQQSICKEISQLQSNKYHEEILGLNFTNILTTNYDYNFTPKFQQRNSEIKYSLKRFQEYKNTKIWHIHGEINQPQSIMLGYDHYLKSISTIHQHLEKYLFKEEEKVFLTWMDIFLKDDIYILGLELDFGELDLWWMISYRNRLKLEHKLVNNKITYIDIQTKENKLNNKHKAKLSMLKTFDIDIKTFELSNNNYQNIYDNIIKYLQTQS